MISFLRIPIAALFAFLAAVPAARSEIPQPLAGKVEALLTRLRTAEKIGAYPVADYFADLTALGKEAGENAALVRELTAAGVRQNSGEALLAVAVDLQRSEEAAGNVRALKDFYGRYAYEIPRESLFKDFADRKIRSFPIPQSAEEARKMHSGPEVYPFVKDFATPGYFTAWEAWFMAPPSKERKLMDNRVREALGNLSDARSIPLILESFRIQTTWAKSEEDKRSAGIHLIGLISSIPGDQAIDAMLECNRYAVAHGFAGEGYRGVERQVVRLFASRSGYAEMLADPAGAKALRESGDEIVKPESIVLDNDRWKTYKPLVAARLKAAEEGSKVPPEDLAILKAAMEIMPKE